MTNDFTLSVGQAHELEMAMNRVGGWDGALVKALSTGSNLADVREVLLKRSMIKPIGCLIDCDAEPFCPLDWKVEEHKKGGSLEWDPTKVKLYLSPNQQNGKCIKGHKLRKELENKSVLNANVLEFLLAHPELIPEGWKGKAIFFWGTIYRDPDGRLCVYCLDWVGARWARHRDWLCGSWGDGGPAACSQA